MRIKSLAVKFPIGSYPVLYKAYWMENLSELYRLKNNTIGNPLQAMSQVYQTYYNKTLDTSTVTSFTFDTPKFPGSGADNRTPYCLIFVINYLDRGKVKYIWEFFQNWVGILQLN